MASQIIINSQYQQKLAQLEKEILKLKKGAGFHFAKKIISLKGLLKGIDITERDIKAAKKSLFKTTAI